MNTLGREEAVPIPLIHIHLCEIVDGRQGDDVIAKGRKCTKLFSLNSPKFRVIYPATLLQRYVADACLATDFVQSVAGGTHENFISSARGNSCKVLP